MREVVNQRVQFSKVPTESPAGFQGGCSQGKFQRVPIQQKSPKPAAIQSGTTKEAIGTHKPKAQILNSTAPKMPTPGIQVLSFGFRARCFGFGFLGILRLA